jgi:hypothetical protein
MFFVFILFFIYIIYLIIKRKVYPKSRCYGDCNPVYKDFEWTHKCDISKFIREPLTTCTDCLKIFDREGCKDCKERHCKCGQRFRFDMPIQNIDMPLWKWCKNCEKWHCINCVMKEGGISSSFPL